MKKSKFLVVMLILSFVCTFYAGAVNLPVNDSMEIAVSDDAVMNTVQALANGQLQPRIDDSISFSNFSITAAEGLQAVAQDDVKDVRFLGTYDGMDLYQATYITRANLTASQEWIKDGIRVYITAVYTQLERSDDPGMTYTRIINMKFGATESQNGYTLKNVQLGFSAFGQGCTSATSSLTTVNYGGYTDARDTLATGSSLSLYNTHPEYIEAGSVAGTSARARFGTSYNSTIREVAIEFGWK